jgi:hypothetical protein
MTLFMTWGLCPQSPRGLTHYGPKYENRKGRTVTHGLHTSVTLSALGSLPSVALSSERVAIKYTKKWVFQLIYYVISML